MAQTTMNIYASDQIFNLVTRLMGTVVGLALGLIAWYMGRPSLYSSALTTSSFSVDVGNGHGNGNPYGTAAAVGLLNIPLVFLRVYAPPQYLAGILLAAVSIQNRVWVSLALTLVGR